MDRWFRAVALLVPLLASGGPVRAESGRLPKGVSPLTYDISVEPDAARLRFTGKETIAIAVAAPTRTITLNAAELEIAEVRLDDRIAPARTVLDEAAQTLTLGFAAPVAAGPHRLLIRYSGRINQSAAGLFAVDYQDAEGRPQRLLVTQFEASDARRFAPMWDEPGQKARFRLSATVPKGQTAFSNMPIERSVARPAGGSVVTFQTSPRMSSYLLFLGMGDVERRTRQVGQTEIGIITRRGAIDQGDYALESAARILLYYNDYFGTPYPLPKLDMIAAPGSSQFFSAMENWGAILYFDRAVLFDPKLSSESSRQYIFTVVAHEMAHQWFGDLVTMAWWDDLWLNEGFASWMEEKASDTLNPEWRAAARVVAFDRQVGLSADAQSSTHAIVRPIETPDQISQAFDRITYAKGPAVIAMLEAAIGPDRFREGVRRYMARYKYGNTRTDDLWAELAAAAGRPVKPLMDAFTLQGGVPLIRVGEPSCVGGTTRVTLSQDRFGLDEPSRAPRRWTVPVTLAAGGAGAQAMVSGPAPQMATVLGCGPLRVNPGQQGYYRTLYADRQFGALAEGFSSLGLVDQVGLLGDERALANGGYVPAPRHLGLLDRLTPDADPLVWELAASQLSGIDALLDDDPAQPAFRRRALRLLAPALARTGLDPKPGERSAMSQLRETLVAVLGRLGDPGVLARARALVAGGLDRIPAAIREPLIGAYAANARPVDWDRLHALARAERDPTARTNLYGNLARTADRALAARALALALTDEATVPNRAALISGVAARHPALAFDWAVEHAGVVNGLVEASSRPRFIVGLASASADPALAARVEAYAARALAPGSRQGAETAIASIRYRARLRAEQSGAIAAWAAR